MNSKKILIAGSVLMASSVVSSVALAESPLTANIGITSDYIWRGVTQSNDLSAVSGGVDYAHDSGFYAGTWLSNLSGGQYEQDWYAGYGFDAGPVGLDVGYIAYTYPVTSTQLDFDEVYVNASWEFLGAGVAYTLNYEDSSVTDENDIYMYVSAEFEVKKDLTLGLLYGDYDYDAAGSEDYGHYQVSLSKDDFVIAFDKNDKKDTSAGEDDMRFSVAWSKSFDL